MFGGAAGTAIDSVLNALTRDQRDNVVSLYLYGSLSSGTYQAGQSDINLLLLVKDDASIHRLRDTLRPVWLNQSEVLKRTPLITTADVLRRHLSFNPGLAHHLLQNGSLLHGKPWLPEIPGYDMVEHLSHLARIALHASAAIAPSLLSEREIAGPIADLRSLTRQLFGLEVQQGENATVLLGQIEADILSRMERHPSLFWKDKRVPDAPPLVSDLRAIYEFENHLILLLPDLGPSYVSDRITTIDWDAVASRISGQYRGLWVTTAAQLRLILQYDSAADYQLSTYNHAWGLNPLSDIQADSKHIFRSFGRLPSSLLVDKLPSAYIQSEDPDLSMLVHDLQNKLLHVQLKNELLCRIRKWPITKPPDPLPERYQPPQTRIDAICRHLNWWSEYYYSLMQESRKNSIG